jgi:hypothetical protein
LRSWKPINFRKKDSGGRSELDRNAVHAVALIGRRLEAFSLEHMAQMPATSSAGDLYPPTIRVSLYTRESDIQYVIQRKSYMWRVKNGSGVLKHTVRVMAPGSPSKKAGQPQPESNLVVDLYRGVPQPTQL